MIINLKEFTTALNQTKSFANDTKNVSGVLLDIKENSVSV